MCIAVLLTSGLIMGPISASGSHPALSLRLRAASAKGADQRSVKPPTNTAAEMAMQRWPAAPNAAPEACVLSVGR